MLDFDDRYAANYRAICALAHRAQNGRCCLCFTAESKEIHHVCYRDKKGAIAGREIPGRHIFGLCKPCHERAHLKDVWIKDRVNPVLGNHNTAQFAQLLKSGYNLLSTPMSYYRDALDALDALRYHEHLDRLAEIRRSQREALMREAELDAALEAAMTYAPIKHRTPEQAQASAALDLLCQQAAMRGTMDAYGLS